MKPFDPNKPVRLRNGKPARIICTDAKSKDGLRPIIALHDSVREEAPYFYKVNGRFSSDSEWEHEYDLINIHEKFRHERWVNVYAEDIGFLQRTRADSDESANSGRIACIKLVIEGQEGDGL